MLRYRYLIMMMKGSYDVERLPAACYLAAALAMYCSRASFRFLVQASVNHYSQALSFKTRAVVLVVLSESGCSAITLP